MPEVIGRELKVYEYNYVCDKCGIGIMSTKEDWLEKSKLGIKHHCNNCGYVDYYPNKYPTSIFK